MENKIFESFKDSINESRIKLKTDREDCKSGDGFTVYSHSGRKDFSIRVNSFASWSTDPNDERVFRLMDAGTKRASIRLPNSFRVSDIADKMHELTKETTWGEKEGFSKNDYASLLRMYFDMGERKRR
jgi:hypothetical protein